MWWLALGLARANYYIPGQSIVIQWGQTRTASTAQHHILCAMANMRNVEAGMKMPRCEFLHDASTLTNGVFKVHSWRSIDAYVQASNNVMVFQSLSRFDKEAEKSLELASSKKVLHSQVYKKMTECPLSTVADYIRYFNLTDVNIQKLKVEFKLWDVTRLCCGAAQALENRLRLHGCPPLFEWYSEQNAFCAMYNLTAVDELVSKLRVLLTRAHDHDRFKDIWDVPMPKRMPASCNDLNDKVRQGHDMAQGYFTNCLDYVSSHSVASSITKEEIRNYACRNKFRGYEDCG